MRVLLTGGSGYIGSRLAAALAAWPEVEEVVNLDLRPPPAAAPRVALVRGSVTEALPALLERRPAFDTAVHLAWAVDPMRDGARQREVCIGGTRRFLEGCATGGVRQILFLSSATAYGAHPAHAVPLDESAPLRPAHHFQYSAEKREAEGMVRAFAESRPQVVVQVARPVVVAGPSVSNFIFRSIERRPAVLPLGCDPEMQLVHEDDCAAALAAILRSRLPGAFNLAAPGTLRLAEAMRRMGRRPLRLPVAAMRALAWAGWKGGWNAVSEAPPGFVWFVAYPWLVSSRRLVEEVGFRFRHDCQATLASYLAARVQAPA